LKATPQLLFGAISTDFRSKSIMPIVRILTILIASSCYRYMNINERLIGPEVDSL